MTGTEIIIPPEKIDRAILFLRSQKVLLDNDLAMIYGVKTKRLNEQVRRNMERFPDRYMFQLTEEEKEEVVANCDHLEALKYSNVLPFAFTEHGAIMLASVLNSETAVKASIAIIDAFLKLQKTLENHQEIWRKLDQMEKRFNGEINYVVAMLEALTEEKSMPRNRVGFLRESEAIEA
jgi:uncharacterized protein (UPF0147 family)